MGTIPIEISKFTNLNALYLNDNSLHTLPLLELIPSTGFLYIENNKFGFNSIVPNLSDEEDLSRDNFTYDPQQLLDTRDTIINKLGNSIELTVSDDHGDNVYQWFKNGDSIKDATNQSYTINLLSYQDIGDYWVTDN